MKSLFSFIVLFLAAFSLSAQVCPGAGSVSTNVPSIGSSSSTSSFTSTNSNGFSGQGSLAMPVVHQLSRLVKSGNYQTAQLAYYNMDGSPYLTKEAVNGQIVMNNGIIIDDVPLKLDVFAQEIVAVTDEKEIVLDTRFYKKITFEQEGQEILLKKVNPNNPDQFYQVLYEDGDMVFYKEKEAKLRDGVNNGMVKTNPKFSQRTNYFIKQGTNDIAKIKLKKKDVFSVFPETEILAMQEYAKRKGIKLKKEADFVAMFAGANDDD